MDRSWMKASRLSAEFERGVIEFIRFAEINLPSPENNDEKNLPPKGKEHFRCPCVLCGNKKLEIHKDKIISHLICNGICQNYTKWIWHGEVVTNRSVSQSENISVDMDDRLEDMMRDIGEDSFKTAHVHDTLCSDKDTPLYPGCTNFTRLSAVLKLFNLKAKNGWTDKSFSELLELLTQMLPEGNVIPNRCYEAKKVLCPMGLEYERIHACPNDCILYRKEFANSDHCPKCMASRYKKKDGDSSDDVVTKKGSPVKVVWYLPIIPRFKRLFANANDAKNLRWHVEERKCDGQIRHVADSLQWKKIDSLFPNFGKESRNLRLGLATDGMNPFGNQSTNHSSWPVLLMIYNLSPWLCMKRKYIMLSMMISGPRQPGNDIDVYLSPLIDDLRVLWEQGVDVFDAYSGEQFNMRAMLFCTINDFPAYGNLSGYSVKGHLACPICAKDTNFKQLKKGKKTVYLGHRRFLNRYHPYRRLRKAFNDHPEDGVAPEPLTGEQVYELQRDINVVFGKDVGKGKKKGKKKSDVEEKKSDVKISWKKRSVFFDLPYWSSLDVRHCIDVMHVEKNVCDSVIGTLLNIAGKTKDGINARLDMDLMGIRKELLPQQINNRTYLPPACYTLSKKEKTSFCECLKSIKVPHGYSSNVNKLVSMNDLKLIGLKSHDCHVLMQQLLPVAIRGILPDNVRKTISRLCLFFNAICCKAIDPLKLDELENEAAVILCQLEMYFPPSFFDIMVHLIVHLVREIRLCGPIYLRWMYPIERYMKILKGYTKNPHRPEASIVERYIAEEAIEFCSNYLSEVDAIGVPKSRHDGRCEGMGIQGLNVKSMSGQIILQAHLYILNNTAEVEPYLSDHKSIVKKKYPRINEKGLLKEHNKSFPDWFREKVANDGSVSDTIKWLSYEPKRNIITWSAYDINKTCFYTKLKDDHSTMQNSGVMVVAESMHFSSSKDKNPVMASTPYYGVIEEIWEVDYVLFKVPLFKCKWININSGVRIDELGFTLVDLSNSAYTDEPFIMASQAKQVFYVKDPSPNSRWSVVLQGKNVQGSDENQDVILDISETLPFSTNVPTFVEENVEDDVQAIRSDHQEGIWQD
ncbi:unnamed protein product [Trifolium pratense]|uniref:Uncharacterized protein n=2 Tax=Trifolium pratense TaxID=57577 RepID=A0ACB0LN40_TRIPR|nr:unnamed protein product [Trifolium pratense]CAJ2669852.1 unnamed protein product [Trifolium pratense]